MHYLTFFLIFICVIYLTMTLEDIGKDYDLYLSYAYKICGCDQSKGDLLSEAYLKLHAYLEKYPDKELTKSTVFLTMRSIFIDGKKKKKYTTSLMVDVPEYKEDSTARHKLNNALSELKFKHREILLRTEESSLREVAKQLNCSHVAVHLRRQTALEKLRTICQTRLSI